MEFLNYSTYPMVPNDDCSPAIDTFPYSTSLDPAYIANQLTPSADIPFLGFEPYFDDSVSSAKEIKGFDVISPISPAQSNFASNPQTFSHVDVFPSGPLFDPNTIAPFSVSLSPVSDQSSSSSPCGDALQDGSSLTSPPLSPPLEPKRETPTTPSFQLEECPSNPPKRKRGRPRLDRSSTSLSSTRAQRLPHTQVERKYREGLNASMERLRKSVPALCQDDDLGDDLGNPRPSKAMILEGAIEYITAIEKERDAYRLEIERLRRVPSG